MPQDNFDLACDRLSHVVDAVQFEQLRWARNEGPMLAKLVDLIRGALEDRPEFELVEEGATKDVKRFVLKVHGHRIIAIAVYLKGTRVVMGAEEIARSRFGLANKTPISAEFERFDQALMSAALMELFGRVRSHGELAAAAAEPETEEVSLLEAAEPHNPAQTDTAAA